LKLRRYKGYLIINGCIKLRSLNTDLRHNLTELIPLKDALQDEIRLEAAYRTSDAIKKQMIEAEQRILILQNKAQVLSQNIETKNKKIAGVIQKNDAVLELPKTAASKLLQ
jgi:hypothetical protein